MAVPEGDKCTQSDSQSPFPMTTCPAPPALQPDTDPSLAATKPSTTSTALITYHSTEIVLFSSHLLEPKAISSAYTPSTLHNLEEPIPPRNQWERPIHPQYQIILQRPSTTPEPTRNYTAVIIVAILILRNVLQQQSTIRALRKWLAILMQWIRRLNPDAGYGVGVFNHTRLIPESEHMEKEKLEPMVMGPAKPHVSDFGGEIVVPGGSVGMEETDPISPLKLDEPSSARTEDLRVTSQVAEESQLSSLSGGEISSQDVCVERIDISTCSSVDIGSFEGVYSATVLLEEEIEPPNDQYLLSPVFSNPLESSKNAITCSISDEENRSTAVSCVPSVSEEEKKCELENEKEVPRDIIEDQYNGPKNDNENTFQGKNEKSMLLLESIDLEVEHTNGEEYHDSGEASQFPIPKGRLPHAGDVSPPRTAAEIFPRPEDAISVPCSGGLNDGGVTSNSREEKTFSVTPIDTESM
jgi:hypothetical protein